MKYSTYKGFFFYSVLCIIHYIVCLYVQGFERTVKNDNLKSHILASHLIISCNTSLITELLKVAVYLKKFLVYHFYMQILVILLK